MKFKQLDLKGKKEFVVEGRDDLQEYNVQYNFSKKKLDADTVTGRYRKLSSYIIKDDLVHAVNAAIVTGRPLLLKGAPGSGKTQLAAAIASYFYGPDMYKNYFEWHVKSKSKAIDLGYEFDHIARLRDATISAHDAGAAERSKNEDNYITLGAMGKAFKTFPNKTEQESDCLKPILLIDEIDKGDIDFPNDLLLELDEMRFRIKEKKDFYIDAPLNNRPLVFITSNDERELPPAFLRRCLYFYIPPFDNELLEKIASIKLKSFYADFISKKDLENQNLKLDEKPIKAFVEKYSTLRQNVQGNKQPSTSEMLDWLKLICFHESTGLKTMKELIDDEGLQNIALKLNA